MSKQALPAEPWPLSSVLAASVLAVHLPLGPQIHEFLIPSSPPSDSLPGHPEACWPSLSPWALSGILEGTLPSP